MTLTVKVALNPNTTNQLTHNLEFLQPWRRLSIWYTECMRFKDIFSYIVVASATIHAFLVMSSYYHTPHNILFQSHQLLSHVSISKTMDSSERWTNPVAMAIINSQRKYLYSRGSNQQPPVLKSCTQYYGLVNPFPHNDTFWRRWETSLLKTLWEKEKLLVTSNFSFSHSVFYLFG